MTLFTATNRTRLYNALRGVRFFLLFDRFRRHHKGNCYCFKLCFVQFKLFACPVNFYVVSGLEVKTKRSESPSNMRLKESDDSTGDSCMSRKCFHSFVSTFGKTWSCFSLQSEQNYVLHRACNWFIVTLIFIYTFYCKGTSEDIKQLFEIDLLLRM